MISFSKVSSLRPGILYTEFIELGLGLHRYHDGHDDGRDEPSTEEYPFQGPTYVTALTACPITPKYTYNAVPGIMPIAGAAA